MKIPGVNVVIKYALLQLPAAILIALILILVQQWFNLPVWVSWGIIIGWVTKRHNFVSCRMAFLGLDKKQPIFLSDL